MLRMRCFYRNIASCDLTSDMSTMLKKIERYSRDFARQMSYNSIIVNRGNCMGISLITSFSLNLQQLSNDWRPNSLKNMMPSHRALQ